MKKKLILLLLIIITSGCSATYNVTLNDDYTVNEEVNVKIDDTEDNYNKVLDLFQNNEVSEKKYKITRSSEQIKIKYKEKYENIEAYVLNSIAYKQVFDDISVDKNRKKTTLSTNAVFNSDNISINKDNDNSLRFLQINVISKLPILSENSDKKSDNTYTWIYNGNSISKNISITYDNKSVILTTKTVAIILLIVVCLSLTGLIIYNSFKESKNV